MISTSRLLLRPFVLTDVARLFVMSRERGIGRWMPDQVYRDEAHAEQVCRALMALTAMTPDPRTRAFVLGIEHERELIGHVGLSPARGSVEIGYAIEDRLVGNGFATEAVTAMVQWGTRTLGLPEILGIVAAENASSCRVLEKAGFLRTGGDPKILVYRFAG
jgi:ribosomal-protein-alanine N-acetyltransferase